MLVPSYFVILYVFKLLNIALVSFDRPEGIHVGPNPCSHPSTSDTVTKLVECEPRVPEIRCSILRRVKPMTYKIYTCRFLAWPWALLAPDKDWLAQCPNNLIECDIG